MSSAKTTTSTTCQDLTEFPEIATDKEGLSLERIEEMKIHDFGLDPCYLELYLGIPFPIPSSLLADKNNNNSNASADNESRGDVTDEVSVDRIMMDLESLEDSPKKLHHDGNHPCESSMTSMTVTRGSTVDDLTLLLQVIDEELELDYQFKNYPSERDSIEKTLEKLLASCLKY